MDTTHRVMVTEVNFGATRFGTDMVAYRGQSLDGRRIFHSLARADQAPAPGDVFLYTISEAGVVIAVEQEAPLLSERAFNEWIVHRMGAMENFLSEPPMTQLLVRDAFMAGRSEVRPDTTPVR